MSTLEFNEALTDGAKIYIYNTQGKLVKDLSTEAGNNMSKITWNGENDYFVPSPPG